MEIPGGKPGRIFVLVQVEETFLDKLPAPRKSTNGVIRDNVNDTLQIPWNETENFSAISLNSRANFSSLKSSHHFYHKIFVFSIFLKIDFWVIC